MRQSKGAGAVTPIFYNVDDGHGGCVGSTPAGARATYLLQQLGVGAAARDHGVVDQRGKVAASHMRRWIWRPLRQIQRVGEGGYGHVDGRPIRD
jgi:hypothetical protein